MKTVTGIIVKYTYLYEGCDMAAFSPADNPDHAAVTIFIHSSSQILCILCILPLAFLQMAALLVRMQGAVDRIEVGHRGSHW